MEDQYSQIKIGRKGELILNGDVLKEGDLLEIDLFTKSDPVIGQTEVIAGEYQISLFDYEYARLIISADGPKAPKARILAKHPLGLPSLNQPFKADKLVKAYYLWFFEEDLVYEFFGVNPDDITQ